MIHGDLHYENVLAADREPWLVIDPKPTSGDPHYEVAPLLWNRWEELAGDVRGGIRRRFLTTVDAAGMDEDRARDWVIVRMIHNAMWELEDHPDAAGHRLPDHVRRDRQGGPGVAGAHGRSECAETTNLRKAPWPVGQSPVLLWARREHDGDAPTTSGHGPTPESQVTAWCHRGSPRARLGVVCTPTGRSW